MPSHDSIKQLGELFSDAEAISKISPKFAELSFDISEISKQCKNPMFMATLLFKLAEEREKTNKLLERIEDKFDEIMLRMKTENANPLQNNELSEPSSILSEQDQIIMHMVHTSGKVTAVEIKTELGYKGTNAASQRLNRLFKEGHLRKLQSGRNVFYLARNTPTP